MKVLIYFHVDQHRMKGGMSYDVIILGGGISGLSAALYTGQAQLKTLVFDTGASQITRVSKLNNYPGIEVISGEELISVYRKQAEAYGAEVRDEEVASAKKEGEEFLVETASGTYRSKYLVVSSNANSSLLSDFGIELEVNPRIPRPINQMKDGDGSGETSIENLYVAGLLAGLPSQAVIAAGQGASVAVKIATKALEKPYMWHDV